MKLDGKYVFFFSRNYDLKSDMSAPFVSHEINVSVICGFFIPQFSSLSIKFSFEIEKTKDQIIYGLGFNLSLVLDYSRQTLVKILN